MSIRIGSRLFAPRAWASLTTLALLVLLAGLGRWQLRRAGEKQLLFDAFANGGGSTLTIAGNTPPLPRYQHALATGHYDPTRQVLIDNMTSSEGRAGYYVITPFALDGGGWLLVNRGWVPLGPSRAQLPDVGVGSDARSVRGRSDHLPSAGIAMGTPAPLAPPFPAVATFPRRTDLERLLAPAALTPAADVLLLDPAEPDGYQRRWSAPGLTPMRHLAYAVQWFGLAAALAVIYVVTNLRRVP